AHLLLVRRCEIAPFVEDVVGGQQHLLLLKDDAAAGEHRGGIGSAPLAGVARPPDEADQKVDAEVAGFTGEPCQPFARTSHKRRNLDQIARRIPGERELGENRQIGARGGGAARSVEDEAGVSVKIPYGWVDLSKG